MIAVKNQKMFATNELFQPESFDKLAKAEAGHWWFRSRNRIILWVLKNRVVSFESFLEVGCGTGFVLQAVNDAYPQKKLEGSDYFTEGLMHARTRVPTAIFRQLDARKMSEQAHYDVIGAFDVIEHINEDKLVLSKLSLALKPGGTLIITVPQHQWLWSAVDEYACHVRRYSRPELVGKVTQSGLKVEYVSSFVCLLVPLMWLSRLGANSKNFDPMDEFRIPSWLNRLLEIIMSFELRLLKNGFKSPVGGSLLLVARKI
jgi:2-polyprenyl-3-methyl-5-hydroxy-6-metoxy-1,4-benzoquinol methylase